MILLECTNCRQTLEVDDAFAGGVCRCRHCGTIQTVPADAPRIDPSLATGKNAPAPVVGGSKSLYRREEQRAGHSSGLDELADIIASSGTLSSGMHRSGRKGRRGSGDSQDRDSRRPDRRLIIAVGLAAVLAVVAAGLAVALFSGGFGFGDDSPQTPNPSTQATFLDVPLGQHVVFVVDPDRTSEGAFPLINELILQSLATLPPGATFQVIYWLRRDLESVPTALLSRTMRIVSPETIAETRKRMQVIITGGTAEVGPAAALAFENEPDTVVLITAKGPDLIPAFADDILQLRQNLAGSNGPIVHTFAVDDPRDGANEPLATIARQTGGAFRGVTLDELRSSLRR